jgi:site-specific DNA recombinase
LEEVVVKVVGYTRVSSQMQVTQGVSLNQQASMIQQWAKAQGYELVGVFTDSGLSGSKLNRPALQEALSVAKKQKALLVVHSLSRLSRRAVDCLTLAEELVKNGCGLVSLTEANINLKEPSGLLVYRLLSAISEGERDTLRLRVRQNMAYLRTKNKLVGAVPYGMDLMADGESLKPNAKEQKTLALMMELHRQGKSLNAIVKALTAKGSVSKTGKAWRPETVRRIVLRQKALKQAA